jgi:hypothetical protein
VRSVYPRSQTAEWNSRKGIVDELAHAWLGAAMLGSAFPPRKANAEPSKVAKAPQASWRNSKGASFYLVKRKVVCWLARALLVPVL